VMQTQVDESEADRFASAFLVPAHLVDISRSPRSRNSS
jgi:Zn-dependent peptidase ImmA (M78 family)